MSTASREANERRGFPEMVNCRREEMHDWIDLRLFITDSHDHQVIGNNDSLTGHNLVFYPFLDFLDIYGTKKKAQVPRVPLTWYVRGN